LPKPTRRKFILTTGSSAAATVIGACLPADAISTAEQSDSAVTAEKAPNGAGAVPITLRINGNDRQLAIDPRTTLLDCIRETISLTGTKKGCDHGQCGACTVHVNGRRVVSCLSLALMHDGEEITTNVGRFGPYVKYGAKYVSLKIDDPYEITPERALEVIREKEIADANRLILDFPDAGIQVLNGRYGPYITDKSRNAKIPKDKDPKSLTLEECQTLLAAAPVRTFGKWGRKNGKAAAKGAAANGKAAGSAPKAAGRTPRPRSLGPRPRRLHWPPRPPRPRPARKRRHCRP